jgi:ATP-dependent exoDNAse (exonuclease V) alpha subunit
MINEFDKVVLTENIYSSGLKVGDVGTIVMIHEEGLGYEVEFMTLDGETIAVETLSANQIRATKKGEIAHVRKVQTVIS